MERRSVPGNRHPGHSLVAAGWRPCSESKPCGHTAILMRQSCLSEADEEYKAVIAHCINFSAAEDRQDCRMEAAEERQDAKAGCFAQKEVRLDVCELLAEDRYDPEPLTGTSMTGESIVFVDPDNIGGTEMPNPYLSLVPGLTQVLRAGEGFEETIVVHVTNQVREILGISCVARCVLHELAASTTPDRQAG